MKIDKKLLDEQLTELHGQLEGAKAQLNGVKGALDLCEHLLKVLEMEEPPKEKVHELKDLLPKGTKIGKHVTGDRTSNEKGEKHGMAKRKKAGNKEGLNQGQARNARSYRKKTT